MIVGVAIKHRDLVIGLPRPNRHHDVIRYMVDILKITPPVGHDQSDGQGFYTEEGQYLNRREAMVYAWKTGYVLKGLVSKELFSENIW